MREVSDKSSLERLISGRQTANNVNSMLSAIKPKEDGTPRTRLEKFAGLVAAGTTAMTLAQKAKSQYEIRMAEHKYTVSVNEDDEMYALVQHWVLTNMTPVAQKAVVARSIQTSRNDRSADSILQRIRARNRAIAAGEPMRGGSIFKPVDKTMEVVLSYDGSREQMMDIGGHKVLVKLEKPGTKPAPSSDPFDDSPALGFSGGFNQSLRIVFTATSLAGRDAVVSILRDLVDEYDRTRSSNRMYTANKWGDWVSAYGIPARSMDTVILKKGAVDDLIDDMTTFMKSEDRYVSLGLPWHRGYLLSGPPGTGKTSVVKAIATEMGLDTHYLPLSDLNQDTDLTSLIQNVGSRGLLLIEDIDVASSSRKRDDTGKGVTTAGLLNALDGVATPHGLITVMTTNNIDVLDKALVRPGRADRIFTLDFLDQDQFKRLCELIVGRPVDAEEIPDISGKDGLSPAQVLEWSKKNMLDPELALKAVTEMTVEWLAEDAEIFS